MTDQKKRPLRVNGTASKQTEGSRALTDAISLRFSKLKLARASRCYHVLAKQAQMAGNAYSGPFKGWWRCLWK